MGTSCSDVCDVVITVLERAGLDLPRTDDYQSYEHDVMIDALYQAKIVFTSEQIVMLNAASRELDDEGEEEEEEEEEPESSWPGPDLMDQVRYEQEHCDDPKDAPNFQA